MLLAFVRKDDKVVAIHHPETSEDVIVVETGALRVRDYDNDVHIYAASAWTSVKVEERA